MKCEDLNDALVDFVDGRLDAATQPGAPAARTLRGGVEPGAPAARTLRGGVERDVERHLEVCDQCAALVTDLRTIRAAAFMLDRREPSPATWTALQKKVAAEPAPRGRLLMMPTLVGSLVRLRAKRYGATSTKLGERSRGGGGRNWPVWLGAAAALVLATVIGLVPLMDRGHIDDQADGAEPAAEVTVESVASELAAAETHYQKAIDDLQTIANADTGELDPQLVAVLQKNLTVIDQAISENRAALKSQPASTNAQDGLFSALKTKVALLQQTVELINEMRKGHQAEAGRKIQTLSQ